MAEPTDKDTRGPVNLRIKFRSESLQQFIERYGVDVSRGGIFIRTREPLPVGTRLRLDFQLVDTAPLFQGDGTVVWIREHDASRAGVTPGMGVRFDRLTAESQTTLDTILEEKIRLQQSGVAPGSIAKAGAGMAVRRPSGAFATLEAQGGKPGGPPPLPVEVKLDTSVGAAPGSTIPVATSRTGPHATTSSSIFNRPRTTSGMRAVPVPSALFEAPTAADIDRALSVLEEKGGPAPALTPVATTVVKRTDAKAIGDDDPTRVFDSSASEEFAQNEAITGKGEVLPETGIPIARDGEGELTERRLVDPASGHVKSDGLFAGLAKGSGNGEARKGDGPPPVPAPSALPGAKPPALLDAPLASLVDSGSAPAAKPVAPPPMKPAAPPATAKPGAAPAKAPAGVPMKITTERPTATESGRFRSDTRYKRRRGKGIYWALLILIIGGGGAAAGVYVKRQREKRAAEAIAAAAAAPPLAAGQINNPPVAGTTAGTEAPTGAGGAAAAPTEETGGGPASEKTAPPKPDEAVAKTDDKPAAKPEKQDVGKPSEKTGENQPPSKRKRERSSASAETAAAKPAESGEKRPGEESKAGGEAAKTDTPKPTEAAKPAESDQGAKGEKAEKTDKGEKPAESAKPAEGEKKPEAAIAPPVLKITSSPNGAEVVIDGVPVGTTPFSSKDISADATHAITVKKDGYETHERMISGSDWSRGRGGAQSLKVNVKLRRAGGEPPKPPPAEGVDKVEILTPSEP